jgi:hypothetical protein
MPDTLFESYIPGLPLIHRGKVRDLYPVGADHPPKKRAPRALC